MEKNSELFKDLPGDFNEELYKESKTISSMIMTHFWYYVYPIDAFDDYRFTGVYLDEANKIAACNDEGKKFHLIQPAPIWIYRLLYLGENNESSIEHDVSNKYLEFFHYLSVWYNAQFHPEKSIRLNYVENAREKRECSKGKVLEKTRNNN
jgi:hypothetical protein